MAVARRKRGGNPARMVLPLMLLAVVLTLASPAAASQASFEMATLIQWEGFRAAAAQLFTPQDLASMEKAANIGRAGARDSREQGPPGYVPLGNARFLLTLAATLKPYLTAGESAKVEKFLQTINRKNLIRGEARWFGPRSQGHYIGPTVVRLSLVKVPAPDRPGVQEYKMAGQHQAAKGAARQGGQPQGPKIHYPTGALAP